MAQKLTQQQLQEQKQLQQLRLSQQQLLTTKLIEMTLDELAQSVNDELIVNGALEENHDEEYDSLDLGGGEMNSGNDDDYGDNNDDSTIDSQEKEDRQDELNEALSNMESDDEREDSKGYYNEDYKEIEGSTATSFIDKLNEQMGEISLTDTEHKIMEYLIGSLDDDGLLRVSSDSIAERLYIDYYIDCTVEDVDSVLAKLQTFDPAGVGAHSLQECLLIQIGRMEEGMVKNMLNDIITNQFEEFTHKHWDKIKHNCKLSDSQIEIIQDTIKRRLNPKPGSSLGETVSVSLDQITPDFNIYITDDDRITFDVNNDRIPQLSIADNFEALAESYRDVSDKELNRMERDAKKYVIDCVDKGNMYIEALRQRNRTMRLTMKAIIQWQRKYFIDGDESELRPMRLEDISEKTQLDISTISRVTKDKYAHTPWGIKPLKFFFANKLVTEDGEELSTRKLKQKLREIIEKEDKKHPYSDEVLAKLMKESGNPIARRTVVKYREQMDIPSSRMRKE